MHQHPRPPPATASPANSEQTNPTRTNNPRDRDGHLLRTVSPVNHGSNSSEDFGSARPDQPADTTASQTQRLNQVIQNFHTKATLIILHSRVDLPPAYSKSTETKRVNRWFNIELDETEAYKEDIKPWKTCDVTVHRPPPLVIEIYVTTDTLNPGQRLIILDDDGKRWDVADSLAVAYDGRSGRHNLPAANEVVLERWTITLGQQSGPWPPDMASVLPLVYKKSIVLFRSLYTYCNFLPAYKLTKKIGRARSSSGMVKLNYRILDGSRTPAPSPAPAPHDGLTAPLYDGPASVVTDYTFGTTDSPAGPFSVNVQYRLNCDFRVDDSEELLSSRFLGSDGDIFQPSLPRDPAHERRGPATQEVGSLPNDQRRNLVERPDLGMAYGSLSTFHQAGVDTDPISALRNAQEMGSESPPTPEFARLNEAHTTTLGARAAARPSALAPRQGSFNFQPFKAPVLSASPLAASPLTGSPRTHAGRMPTLRSLNEEQPVSPDAAGAGAAARPARKSVSLASDHAVASSTSSSPKPAPIARYSSSFSHRRARWSSGGTGLKVEEDQTSSGKDSATSSAAQPGSGLLTETTAAGGSPGAIQEDDDNIADFLKMLDTKKNLLAPADASAAAASTRRTTAALTRFHRMRDSNATLSDSMSSSLLMHRSSSTSSRQLSSVPPMVAATSVSTSSSPGKPISPHTPHMPFAPSRLSAAYNNEDVVPALTGSEDESSEQTPVIHDPDPLPLGPNPNAIDIPNSPRYLSAYQRSSSAQRRPLSADEAISDAFTRSSSMGAPERRHLRRDGASPATAADVDVSERTSGTVTATSRPRHPDTSPRRMSPTWRDADVQAMSGDGAAAVAVANSPSGDTPSPYVRRPSRLSRGGIGIGLGVDRGDLALASAPAPAPPPSSSSPSSAAATGASTAAAPPRARPAPAPASTSNSSLAGGTGASVNRDRDSGGSVVSSSSWARGAGGGGGAGIATRRARADSRPESKGGPGGCDDDDYLPFAMEKSDFTTAAAAAAAVGVTGVVVGAAGSTPGTGTGGTGSQGPKR